ncbi:MAG: helix-turn-helix domain-containing protein, partial [Actinobacteria bacterium]|nr:helix-turn-helix domain-containing protein [Actinomycetota bacterium]
MVQATSQDEALLSSIVSLVWSFRDLAAECGVPGEPGDRTILRVMAVVQRSATPPRISEVADSVGLDLSTTSRHCATLGRDGL